MESCESMLRGCVGLDVTAFFLIMLVRLLEVSSLATSSADQEVSFDIYRLSKMVALVLEDSDVNLLERLKAVLHDDRLADGVLEMAIGAIAPINKSE